MIWKKADQELPKPHRVDILLSICDHGKCCTGKSFLFLFPFFLILIGKSSHTRLKFIPQCVIMVHAFFFSYFVQLRKAISNKYKFKFVRVWHTDQYWRKEFPSSLATDGPYRQIRMAGNNFFTTRFFRYPQRTLNVGPECHPKIGPRHRKKRWIISKLLA